MQGSGSDRKRRKEAIGEVVSNRMQKTVVVKVEWSAVHPVYKKVLRRQAKFKAHDEHGCRIGDLVKVIAVRPLSREKRWIVVEILQRAAQTSAPPVSAGERAR